MKEYRCIMPSVSGASRVIYVMASSPEQAKEKAATQTRTHPSDWRVSTTNKY
jgi:hypothetical protein